MTTEQKKKWVVRTFSPSTDGSFLERLLNELHEQGYTIWEIDLKIDQVIAYLRDEPPGKAILEALMKGNVEKVSLQAKVEEDDPEELDPRSAIGKRLALELIALIRAHHAGSPGVKDAVKKLAAHVASRCSANDVSEAIEDFSRMRQIHKDRVAKESEDGQPCTDTCSVNAVLLMFVEQLKAQQELRPLS